jgi:hypothetical protein
MNLCGLSIVAHAAGACCLRSTIALKSASVSWTHTRPFSSVRSTGVRALASNPSVSCAGWAKSFGCPTLMTESRGDHSSSARAVMPFALPWCGTLSMSIRCSLPRRSRLFQAGPSASPVSSAVNCPRVTSSTTLVSLVERPGSGPGGHSTSSLMEPTTNPLPALSVRMRTPSLSPPPIRAEERRTASNASSSATSGTKMPLTEVKPTRPSIPPV